MTAGWRQLATPKSARTNFSPSPICTNKKKLRIIINPKTGLLFPLLCGDAAPMPLCGCESSFTFNAEQK
jgi:hypothetical protein